MEPVADPGADSPPPVDVTVTGGHFGHAVLGTQIINRNTVVHQHGHFRLSSHITVSEIDPINRESRIYRAKLHSVVRGDLEIAVKILSDGERQRREAGIHFKVPHHINIVERIMTDAFNYQGQSCIYIAMEQCDPQNLYAYVVSLAENNAPYDAEMFMSFAFQIATGLEFLHRHKILNRDLKPENILLSADKKIAKIADFGMSKEMTGEASTVSTLQPGTNGWRSPEILKNVRRITLASDMFSLGLIFNFLWSYGKHAFGNDSHAWNLYIKQGINMTLDGLKIPNSNVAKRLLKSLLRQNPTERPSALNVLRNRVFEVPRLQSDSAAIYTGIAVGNVQGYSEGAPEPTQKSESFFGKLWKNLDRKSSKTSNNNSNNIVDVRRNLQEYGIWIQRFTSDINFGKEWEGRFSDQKVTVTQFSDVDKYANAVDVLTNLEHENIECFIKAVPEFYVIVTEFYDETLQEYLQGNGNEAELSNLLRMAAQVASGMDFLHRKNYIHCDLRAGNVFVTANLICKISEFSLSQYVGIRGFDVWRYGIYLPVKWAEPEVLEKGNVTFKSDVWSFGVLLWEIVTRGRTPYPGMSDPEVLDSISSGYRMCKPWKCPSRLYFDIMRPCWDEIPDARPTFECLEKNLLSYDVEADEKEENMSVRTLSDYTKDKEDELSFKKGDVIADCTEDYDGARLKGTLDGQSGYFPSIHVIQIRSKESTNVVDVRRNLQEHGVDVQRLRRDFEFGKEWEGRFSDQKVTVTQLSTDKWKYDNAVGVLTNVEHENIVRFIKEVPEFYVIATEFYDETLFEYLRGDGKQAELSDLLRMAAQVASGMDFLHRKKYIHRNLHADSVAVTANSICKISGFFWTQHVENMSLQPDTRVPGRWAAPEVYDRGTLTFESDVWSFGVVLWEIVTRGRLPYPGMSSADVRECIRGGYRLLKPQQCPSGLYFDIMRPCWDENPDARPTFQCLKKTLLSYDVEADEQEENMMTVRTLSDYTGAKEDELSFKKGDVIADCTHYDGARLKGTLDGQSGYFPSKHVIQIRSKESTNIIDVRRYLQGYGISVQRLKRDFEFGKEWEGRFSDQKVTIRKFSDAEKYGNAVGVLTNVEHENIVRFIKEVPEFYVIATEFCDGTLLEYLLGDGKQAELTDLLRMAAQVASGMDFLHRKKYIHRNLDPESVAVTANSICKISGFFWTRHVENMSLQPDTRIPGRWAAPEVYDRGTLTFESDVWSFGVVLWEIVTRGRLPYPGMSSADVRECIRGGYRLLKPQQCPSGLYFDIMRPCWDENPDARPTFQCLKKTLLSYDVEADEKEENMTVRTLSDYTKHKEDELSFKKGDAIADCTEYDDGARLKGTLDGQSGYFPSIHVIQIRSKESTNVVDVRRNLLEHGVDVQRLRRDFEFGKEWEAKDDELSFKKVDVNADCTEYHDDARLKGTLDGQSGSFPSKHVIQIKSKESTDIVDLRRNLQGHGISVQRLGHYFQFGKEWEGRFGESRVTITKYAAGCVEKYQNAVNTMRDLEHENIVRFLKEVPELRVVITELCKVTLLEYLRAEGKQAELNDLLRMAAQIASGMDFLHQKKYVYCDLRAGNIVVAGSLICKISGFGMTQHVGLGDFAELQDETKLPIKWAAPETLECRQTTFKSDVWSFGVLLWEVATRGQTPYPGIAKADVAKNLRAGHRMPQPEHCPRGLYFDIMRTCWDENPDARPTFQCLEKTLLSYDLAAEEKGESMIVRALYDYTAADEDQLSFKKRDIIVDCTNRGRGAWSHGTLDGKKGAFPSNYVIQIKNKEA